MVVRNTLRTWGSVALALHWTIAGLVITQFIFGVLARNMPLGMEKLAALARHKSVGITILGLMLIRMVWRFANPSPPLPDNLKLYERNLAHFTHVLLYVLLILMPFSGWLMSSARSFSVSWFGLFQLPDLVGRSEAVFRITQFAHEAMAWILGAVALLHVAAALKHHFVLKDDVLRRMLPFNR